MCVYIYIYIYIYVCLCICLSMNLSMHQGCLSITRTQLIIISNYRTMTTRVRSYCFTLYIINYITDEHYNGDTVEQNKHGIYQMAVYLL